MTEVTYFVAVPFVAADDGASNAERMDRTISSS